MDAQILTWMLGLLGTIIGGILLARVRRIDTSIERIDQRDLERAKADGRCEVRHEMASQRLDRLENRK